MQYVLSRRNAVSCALIAILSTTAAANTAWIEGVPKTIDRVETASTELSPQRVAKLDLAAEKIAAELKSEGSVTMAFICTHNSRRSHLAQIWATVAAAKFGLENVHCVSGGTETTACNPRIVASLRRAGFDIETVNQDAANPTYQLRYAESEPTISLSSKRFQDATAGAGRFMAMLCCSDADEKCPNISGAIARVALHYKDPKASDGTPLESDTYDERRDEIGAEMMYLMKRVAEQNHS